MDVALVAVQRCGEAHEATEWARWRVGMGGSTRRGPRRAWTGAPSERLDR